MNEFNRVAKPTNEFRILSLFRLDEVNRSRLLCLACSGSELLPGLPARALGLSGFNKKKIKDCVGQGGASLCWLKH